ncbi:MAG TPA: SDR family oxidoreductase [bacterium]|nr:SDR family oxidoreductase [bacterium]
MESNLLSGLKDKVVLVTGGTRGIGLCTALSFAGLGAKCVITYHWGTAEHDQVLKEFEAAGAKHPPLILQADVSNHDDTVALMKKIGETHDGVDAFISNVSLTSVIQSLEDYSFRALKKSLAYSAWPTYEYVKRMKAAFGRYPKYVVGISTTGIDHYNFGYDYVAASKVAMESLCRYMTYRLRNEDIHINIIRTRGVRTWSMEKTFGEEFLGFAKHFMHERHWMQPKEVADATVALCSGFLDGMKGQIVNVDRGMSFFDNLMHFYTKRESFGLRFED